MLTSSPVIVMQVPEQMTARKAQDFVTELAPLLQSTRPRIVLEFSQVRFMDSAGVQALLHCLEEALKRDGDLKLAALCPETVVVLELLRAARVFEMFATSEDAVKSFNAIPVAALAHGSPWYSTVFRKMRALRRAS